MYPRDISYSSQGNNKRIVPSSPLSSVWLETFVKRDNLAIRAKIYHFSRM